MKELKTVLGNLKTLNDYSATELKNATVTDEILEDFNKAIEREKVTKSEINKERKEYLKHEIARIETLKKLYGSTKDFVKKIKYTNEGESLVIDISDWHIGKVITDESGKELYNTDIAVKLMTETFVERIIKLIKRIGEHTKIEDVVVLLGGDIIENEIIYTTQSHHIDSSVVRQRQAAVRGILKFIDAIEQAFVLMGTKQIPIRVEAVRGNHGRVGTGTTTEESSWDIVVYDELDLVYSAMKKAIGKDNVSVSYSWGDYKTFNVRGHKGLLRHTAPVQSETNASRGKFGGWCEIFDWDFMVYGHYHHWGMFSYNGRPIFRNGSICGSDNLATEMAVSDRPCQLIFGISDKEVPTFMYKVNLD